MKTTSRFALAAAAGLFVGAMAFTPAKAADLGGDCCADLEERVAELEATTVRKGNRVVSVQLYGQVNKALLLWDDGVDSDVFVVDNDMSSTRLGLRGTGTVTPGLTAGYRIEFDIQENDTAALTQLNQGTQADLFDIRHAHVYLEGNFGRLSLGQQSEATDGAAYANLGGTLTASDTTYAGSFIIRDSNRATPDFGPNANASWSAFLIDGDGTRTNSIRYDSPSLAGFIVSASWGEDDRYDAALRFSQEWNSIRVAAAIGYRVSDVDIKTDQGVTATATDETETVVGSASVMHVPTGLFVFGSASETNSEAFNGDELDQSHYYGQIGVNRNFTGMGATRVYGEYGVYDYDADTNNGAYTFQLNGNNFWESAETTIYGLGVEQDFDSAATKVYLHYKHYELDDVESLGGATLGASTEDLDVVVGGMRVQF